jgi:hypothetical protein
MGAGDLAASALRVSLGWGSSDTDIEAFFDAFGALARRHSEQRATSFA